MTDQSNPTRNVDAREALRLAADGYRIIDVREQVEWDAGHIPGATLLPLADVASRYAEILTDPNAPLLLHCAVGARSARAAAFLAGRGYTDIANLTSLADWRSAGGAWEVPEQLLTPA